MLHDVHISLLQHTCARFWTGFKTKGDDATTRPWKDSIRNTEALSLTALALASQTLHLSLSDLRKVCKGVCFLNVLNV